MDNIKSVRNTIGGLGNLLFKEAYIYAQMRKGLIPDLYVQDEKYFGDYADEIRQRFGDDIGYLPYVSIHIRRGDYINNPFYVDLTETDYYKRAIELFPRKEFLVFSDDRNFAYNFFEYFKGFKIADNKDELEDFNQIASCESNIIANSSFSWWAAYLNPNPNKIVVAPKAWHPDGVERTKIPDSWIKI